MRAYIEASDPNIDEKTTIYVVPLKHTFNVDWCNAKWSFFMYNEDGDLITNFAQSHDDESKAERIIAESLREDEI